MKNYARELKLEEMENVNGGVHGEIFVYQQELENEKLAAQRADFLKRKKEAHDLRGYPHAGSGKCAPRRDEDRRAGAGDQGGDGCEQAGF